MAHFFGVRDSLLTLTVGYGGIKVDDRLTRYVGVDASTRCRRLGRATGEMHPDEQLCVDSSWRRSALACQLSEQTAPCQLSARFIILATTLRGHQRSCVDYDCHRFTGGLSDASTAWRSSAKA